jgi:hypothetical protein
VVSKVTISTGRTSTKTAAIVSPSKATFARSTKRSFTRPAVGDMVAATTEAGTCSGPRLGESLLGLKAWNRL